MGEAGIGKTTLLRQLLDHCPPPGLSGSDVGMHRAGGARRAYLPVLEAMGRLGRELAASGGWPHCARRRPLGSCTFSTDGRERGEALRPRCRERVATACCGSWSTRSRVTTHTVLVPGARRPAVE